MSAWTHPRLTNDFRDELERTCDADPDVRNKAHPLFAWIAAQRAEARLQNALAEFAPLKPVPGLEGKPDHWRSPPPSGAGNHVGIVMGLDSKGAPFCVATNIMSRPDETVTATPADFLMTFNLANSTADQARLIHQTISSVASNGKHFEQVDRVCKEGHRYRTMAIFVVIIDQNKQHFYATTALVDGARQCDFALERTGKVR